jgi:hypothetical protein
MSRTIHADTLAKLASNQFETAHLVKIDFSSAIYLTDNGYAITHGGNTYEPGGHLIGQSEIKETAELKVGSSTLLLSGVEQTYISAILGGAYVNRQVLIHRVVLESGAIVGDPILVLDGRIAHFSIADSEDSSQIQLTIASHWADFLGKNGRVTSDNSQRSIFSGDKGMEFSAQLIRDISWGR